MDEIKFKVCEMEFNLRNSQKWNDRLTIKSSRDAEMAIRPYFETFIETKEMFMLMLCNQANQNLMIIKISEGTISSTVVDVRFFIAAVGETLASSAFIFHNHPSGNLNPSKQDEVITKQFKDVGKLINCPILDHIILTADSYFSFSDSGIL